jgi:hypothetical protein
VHLGATVTEATSHPHRVVKPSAKIWDLLSRKATTGTGELVPKGVSISFGTDLSAQSTTGETALLAFAMGVIDMTDPVSVPAAEKREDAPKWREVRGKEMEMFKTKRLWVLVLRLPVKNVVGSKWVQHIKTDKHGDIASYKARLMAQGFSQ